MNVRVKFLLGCCLLLLACHLLASMAQAQDLLYQNDRYGFTLKLPESDWQVQESANGDGATFSSKSFDSVVFAYGTNSYSVLGQDINAVLKDMRQQFAKVNHQDLKLKKGSFDLLGLTSDDKLQFIRAFFHKDQAIICILKTDMNQSGPFFDLIANAIRRSFKVK